jgi:hypothetical protein
MAIDTLKVEITLDELKTIVDSLFDAARNEPMGNRHWKNIQMVAVLVNQVEKQIISKEKNAKF